MSVARPVQAVRSSLHIAVSCSTQKPRLARDNTNDEWDLLLPQRDLFKRARDTLGEEDAGPDVQRWTVAWLSRAQQLRDERNKVVHSIVHNDGR